MVIKIKPEGGSSVLVSVLKDSIDPAIVNELLVYIIDVVLPLKLVPLLKYIYLNKLIKNTLLYLLFLLILFCVFRVVNDLLTLLLQLPLELFIVVFLDLIYSG